MPKCGGCGRTADNSSLRKVNHNILHSIQSYVQNATSYCTGMTGCYTAIKRACDMLEPFVQTGTMKLRIQTMNTAQTKNVNRKLILTEYSLKSSINDNDTQYFNNIKHLFTNGILKKELLKLQLPRTHIETDDITQQARQTDVIADSNVLQEPIAHHCHNSELNSDNDSSNLQKYILNDNDKRFLGVMRKATDDSTGVHG